MLACPSCGSVYARSQEFCGLDGARLMEVLDDPLVGRSVGRYVIERPLGAGGMARVYRGKHEVLDRLAAVKVLHGELSADQHLAKRFEREARSLSRIRHPNVVEVLDFGRTESGLLYMVMELVEGRTLADFLRRSGPLPPSEAARLVGQITEGLEAAHRTGYVHRDLKPQNLLLDVSVDPVRIKILDFGLVGLVEGSDHDTPLTRLGTFFGTPTYMSPEQAAGERAGPPSDMYALGVVLYEMLTGSAPFSGDVRQLAHQHIHVEPARPSLEYGGLTDLALRLLAKAPADRPTPGELMAALGELDFSSAPTLAVSAQPSTPGAFGTWSGDVLAAPSQPGPPSRRGSGGRPTPRAPAPSRPSPSLSEGPALPPALELPVPIERDEFSVLDGTSHIYEREALGSTRRTRALAALALVSLLGVAGYAAWEYENRGPPPLPGDSTLAEAQGSFSEPAEVERAPEDRPSRSTGQGARSKGRPPAPAPPTPESQRPPNGASSPPAPSPSRQAFVDADTALGRALYARGLAWSDLEAEEPAAARQWAEWFRAKEGVDAESLASALGTLEAALGRLEADRPRLLRRLSEVKARFRALPRDFRGLERVALRERLRQLEAALDKNPLEDRPSAIRAGLDALEADLVDAARRAKEGPQGATGRRPDRGQEHESPGRQVAPPPEDRLVRPRADEPLDPSADEAPERPRPRNEPEATEPQATGGAGESPPSGGAQEPPPAGEGEPPPASEGEPPPASEGEPPSGEPQEPPPAGEEEPPPASEGEPPSGEPQEPPPTSGAREPPPASGAREPPPAGGAQEPPSRGLPPPRKKDGPRDPSRSAPPRGGEPGGGPSSPSEPEADAPGARETLAPTPVSPDEAEPPPSEEALDRSVEKLDEISTGAGES